ncbi:MAG: HEAT repeat domain-containing protein [Gemmatimonadota bacterium]
MKTATLLLGISLMAGNLASAQTLSSRIGDTKDGLVRFTYAARPGVCGDGGNSIRTGDNNYIRNGNSEGNCPCEYGPVRVTLTLSQGTVTRMRVGVGSHWRDSTTRATELGQVSVNEASTYLLSLARTSRNQAGSDAVFAVTLADSTTPWPELIRLARSPDVRNDTRKQSVFWLGQAAGDVATKDLADLAEDDGQDREVRESAVFALSQLDSERGVPALIRIARSNRDPKLRRTALFWLGQSNDPRALDLFEDILANN